MDSENRLQTEDAKPVDNPDELAKEFDKALKDVNADRPEQVKQYETPLGAYVVGLSFNPSGNDDVDFIKGVSAQLIDYITEAGKDDRCTQLAITHFETAAMFAVKSVTKQPRT